jgi:hypothetical protein
MLFKKLQCHGGYYIGKGKVHDERSLDIDGGVYRRVTADGDNLAMVVFFSLFGDKNCNVGGNSAVANGLMKIPLK